MAVIKAFKGIRPSKAFASLVASKPYDVLNTEEAKMEANGNPYSFLQVIKPEITFSNGISPYDKKVYARARENFLALKNKSILLQDETDNLYIYRQSLEPFTQTGIVACSSVQDYLDDVIKKHEYTRKEKEADRIAHMETAQIHSGPVFITYPNVKEIETRVLRITNQTPEYDFVAPDEVRHTFWVVSNPAMISAFIKLFAEQVPVTYIADGHHRAASSARVGQKMARKNPAHTGEEEYNFFLSVLFPSTEVNIIDYNRVISDLNGLDEKTFFQLIQKDFSVTRWTSGSFKPENRHEFGMYISQKWYRLKARAHICEATDPVGSLDISILSRHLLDPVLGIKDQRTDTRIDFVGGIRGMKELQRRVDSGEMKLAFSVFPVTTRQLMKIADSGQVMPPKSTWFEPKLRSGLVVHEF